MVSGNWSPFSQKNYSIFWNKWTNHESGSSVCGISNEMNVAYDRQLISTTKHSLLGIEVYTWRGFLPSATKLRQSNIFTGLSVCQLFCSKGGCLTDTPWQTPNPLGRHSQTDKHPPPHHFPRADTCRRPLQRTIRILLDCGLVTSIFPFYTVEFSLFWIRKFI